MLYKVAAFILYLALYVVLISLATLVVGRPTQITGLAALIGSFLLGRWMIAEFRESRPS